MSARAWLALAVALAVGAGQAGARASGLPSREELGLYYTLGGGAAVPPSPGGETLRLKLLPDIQAGAGYSCGTFDFRLQIEQILQQLEDQLLTLKSLPQQYLLALPGGLFCRAFPGACQLMQYYTARAGEAYELSLRSCREIEQDIVRRGPVAPWVQVAKSKEWSRQAQRQTSAVTAQRAAEGAGDQGLVWVGGARAGGLGQPLIRPVYDSARAGWCMLNREAVDCRESAEDTQLRRLFASPQEAGAWLVDVVGELAVSTAANTASPTVPGHGLLPLIEAEKERILPILRRMVKTDPVLLQEEEFAELSSSHLVMHREIIDGLQAKPDAGWRVERLASELATARVVEKAFVARSVLMTGRQEPNVAALDPAQTALTSAFDRLNHQISFVLEEVRSSHRLAAQTIRTFLEYETLADALNPIRLSEPNPMRSLLQDGGIPDPGE